EVGAEIEQIVLDHAEHGVERAAICEMQPHHADRSIGLVDRAIGRDAQIVFRPALAGAERGGAVIAGAGVDAVAHDHVGPLLLYPLILRSGEAASRRMKGPTPASWFETRRKCDAPHHEGLPTVPSPRPRAW